jgi:hypothetical protein
VSPRKERPQLSLQNHGSYLQNLTLLKQRSISPMSALDQEQPSSRPSTDVRFILKADLAKRRSHVRQVPNAESRFGKSIRHRQKFGELLPDPVLRRLQRLCGGRMK